MRVSEFDYDLAADRIAQHPVEPRDSSRLLVVRRSSGDVEHRRFRDLPELLAPGDLVVANDTKVIAGRLRGCKVGTGGRVQALLLRPADSGDPRRWLALVRGRVSPETRLAFAGADGSEIHAVVRSVLDDGARELRFERDPSPLLDRIGEVPLPPYIRQPLTDADRYQTVYNRVAGSAAAPTAGLHFTPALIERLARRSIGLAFVTLHVGADTFRPMTEDEVEQHQIHSEWACVPAETALGLQATQRAGGRIVAIGTTTVRALESAALQWADGAPPADWSGWTRLFIRPGHRFLAVDALVTNFHLPRSTLLVLVASFAGKSLMDRAYAEAIADGYRFYSFGDAMLVL